MAARHEMLQMRGGVLGTLLGVGLEFVSGLLEVRQISGPHRVGGVGGE